MATYTIDTLPNKLTAGDIINCEYSGKAKSMTLPKGTYQFECWGAQGGSASSYTGGKGGYSVGKIILKNNILIFLYVGGAGTSGVLGASGGFNGGGQGVNPASSSSIVFTNRIGSGGGASDIRLNQNSFYARVIVAGGGGGSYSYKISTSGFTKAQSGGYGGGSNTVSDFGIGQNGISRSPAGGGGGWYGGQRRYGGSSYVYTSSTASNYPSGCLLNSDYYLIDARTIAGTTSFPSTSGSMETGHEGAGYIRITVIEAGGKVNLRSKINNTWKDSSAAYVKINGIWQEVESVYTKINGSWKQSE